ncbi:MAG: enoyl-CoA hydratase-related protein [Candidatus Eremiobacteraeota bacterium]|nr:enoyl-CoA hydratase-related protein [Candidatus Eremiobacteraeota bacterium]
MSDEIRLGADAGVATIEINRPHKKNALSTSMYDCMTAALEAFDADPGIGAVILRGGADFTAGNDLLDFMSADITDFAGAPPLRYLFALQAFSKPIIAAVSGVAIGIGTTMLLHADFVFAGESATFALPFVKIGLVPEGAATLLLPLAAGLGRARRYLLTGETFDAATALELGIVGEVTADGDLQAFAREQAAALAALPAHAVRETKRLLRAPLREAIASTLLAEAQAFGACLQTQAFRTAAERLIRG